MIVGNLSRISRNVLRCSSSSTRGREGAGRVMFGDARSHSSVAEVISDTPRPRPSSFSSYLSRRHPSLCTSSPYIPCSSFNIASRHSYSASQTLCNDVCVDTHTGPRNCGSCGNVVWALFHLPPRAVPQPSMTRRSATDKKFPRHWQCASNACSSSQCACGTQADNVNCGPAPSPAAMCGTGAPATRTPLRTWCAPRHSPKPTVSNATSTRTAIRTEPAFV